MVKNHCWRTKRRKKSLHTRGVVAEMAKESGAGSFYTCSAGSGLCRPGGFWDKGIFLGGRREYEEVYLYFWKSYMNKKGIGESM